jgi:hypothetical protein
MPVLIRMSLNSSVALPAQSVGEAPREGRGGGSASEPQWGFEPQPSRLRGGCSNRLSFSGIGSLTLFALAAGSFFTRLGGLQLVGVGVHVSQLHCRWAAAPHYYFCFHVPAGGVEPPAY